MSVVKEFKDFLNQGNVIDLAVAVVIGAAFGKIVTSMVDDILMPVIGLILGEIDFKSLSFTAGDAVIKYGNFIQNAVEFLIVAFAVFCMVKMINKGKSKAKKSKK